ncbi:MAG: hypothetical protein D6693_06820 [Planctomycetota bacterium]|nr:MAG: hypothetical protein D6693_06820 [Planctomycetota bacterium]
MTRLIRTLSCALAALVMAAPAALAQDGPPTPEPQEIARRCVGAIGDTTQATVQRIGNLGQAGVRTVAALHQHGAPPPFIAHVGRQFLGAINRTAAYGAGQASRIAYACVMVLDEVGAPDALIAVVVEARRACLEAIGAARDRAASAVKEALDRTLMDGAGALAM